VEQDLQELRQSDVIATLRSDQLSRLIAHVEHLRSEVDALVVNQESLKHEVRSLETTVLDLGWAIAPGAGIAGAETRLAELRERVNGLDRRLRALPIGAPDGSAPDGSAPSRPASEATPSPEHSPSAPQSALFDYVGFERRFRGDPQQVTKTLWERYGERLASHAPVVDLGCGRAELLVTLGQHGVAARGVDTDPSMVLEARDAGLDVTQADALAWLQDQPEHSIGSLIATHLVEHLQLDDLVRLLELAATRLKPGGLFIIETPNPQSLIVLGNSYVLDPTHVRPVHPSLLTFLLEGAGFRYVSLEFYAPAEGYQLQPITAAETPAWVADINRAFAQLNDVLFGPQDYAAIARTPADHRDGEGSSHTA
jgi:SAM-dependent methyltransferase